MDGTVIKCNVVKFGGTVIDDVCKYDTNTLVSRKSFYLCIHAVLLTLVRMHAHVH